MLYVDRPNVNVMKKGADIVISLYQAYGDEVIYQAMVFR